ncbi:MAG: ComEC/Rec2 family competence protein [Aridibacter sp.]
MENVENTNRNFTFYPLLWLSISFAIGIFLADLLHFDWKIYLAGTLIFSVFTIIFLKNSYAWIFVLAAFVFVGGFYFQIQKQNEPKNSIKNLYDSKQINSGDPVELEGVLQSKPELSVGGFFLVLDAENIFYTEKEFETTGKVRFFAPVRDEQIASEYAALNLHYGAKIRVAANLNREERFLNPGGVSFTEILDQKDIHATATIKSPLLIERLEDKQIFSPFAWIYDYRQNLVETFSRKFNTNTAGILIASTLGNRNYLTKNTAEIFREGGTFHVLVISGLHITFIGGILLLIVRTFTRKRLWQFVITNSALWIYSLAVGAEIPVIRAALMFTILLFSFVIYRRGTLLNALGACAFLILLWRPADLFNQSFHLTFASLVGIIAFAFPLIEKLRAIGSWMPSVETPFPPIVSRQTKTFCETLFWNEQKWERTLRENIWDCRIFKSDYGIWLSNHGLQKPLRWIFEGILVTAIVQIFLLPFLILYFHRLSFASILLNLWVGFFVVLQNLTAIVAVFFAQLSDVLALPFIKLAEIFNWILLSVPQIFIEFDFASIRVPIYSGELKAIYFLYFLPLIVLTFFLNKWNPFSLSREWRVESGEKEKRKLSGIITKKNILLFHLFTFSLFFFLIVFHPFSSPNADGKLTVDFLDVGQGDSALIRFPNGETMLIDGGGKGEFNELFVEKEYDEKEQFEPDMQGVGETVVSEFLWEKGYSSVDYLLATHADADHIQGLINVAKNFKIKAAFVGREAFDDGNFAEFAKVLERKNIQIFKLNQGNEFEIGGVKIDVLNPVSTENSKNSANNDSIVLRLMFGSREFLLTGDIEKETEKELLENPAFLKSDIVKVAHHGSRTSSTQEFIEATKTEYAIIPVGRKSRFGHPHKEIVERWKNSGAKVLTTGERGTITISTDGKNLEIQTFRK